jgi:hypothetical protein
MKIPNCKSCGDTNQLNFYSQNKSICKKCASKKSLDRYKNLSQEEKIKYKNKVANWQVNKIYQYRFLQAKNRAKISKIDFTITADDIKNVYEKQNGLCYYSGIVMQKDRTGIYTLSVDRKNSKKGYTPDNIVLCTTIVNSMKNKLPIDEFISIVKAVAEHTSSSTIPIFKEYYASKSEY